MKKNKDKFLQHFRQMCQESEKCMETTINLDWPTVEKLLDMDRKILEKLFHNLQKLENETMDLFNVKS